MSANAKKASHEPVWQLQEAKARLSEVVRRAVDEGPQHVSVRGADSGDAAHPFRDDGALYSEMMPPI
jgi:hypothetical protein